MEQVLPKIRFPEFNENWEKKKLGEISQLITKGTTPKKFINEGIKFIKLECFEGDKINGDKCLFIDENTHNKELKRSILKENDLLFAIAGATIGKVNFVTNEILPANTNQALSIIRLKEEECKNYIYQILKSDRMKRYITDSISVGAQPNLNLEQMNNFTFFYPTIVEQSKIAKFLTTVDEKLQTLKQKKTLLEQYKKGVMQKIFSQELRFKDNNGNEYPDWEEKKLGDVGETYNGLTGKTKENFGSGKSYIQYKQIFDDSKIDISRFELVEISPTEKQNKVLFGDVFFTISSETPNEIGMSSVLLDEIEELYLNSFCFGYRANSMTTLSPYFSKYLFRCEVIRNQIIKLAQGSTRFNMSKVQLMKLIIYLPNLEEQTKIANFLSAIDEKIDRCQEQIVNTEVWKKGLLQQMFV
jgi:type I restriction enzyme S subunit